MSQEAFILDLAKLVIAAKKTISNEDRSGL